MMLNIDKPITLKLLEYFGESYEKLPKIYGFKFSIDSIEKG